MKALKPLVILGYPKIDHEKNYVYSWMPFSVLAIAKELLRRNLVDVKIFDGNQHNMDEWELLLREDLQRTLCIGISILTGGNQIAYALKMAKIARALPGCPPLVFGGPHVNVLPEQCLTHPLVDVVLQGPGQTSMPAFVEALQGQKTFDDVPGLLMKQDHHILRGPANSNLIRHLKGYPWQLLNIEEYIRKDPTVSDRTLNYVSSQGCIYKCRFCYELTYKGRYSRIPANELLDEIGLLVSKHRLNGIKFYDADWCIDVRRAIDFADGLIKRDINIRWAASINPNDILRARRLGVELLSKLAQSGCRRLLMGVESGSNRVLEEIVKKEVTRETILDVAAEIATHGIIGSYTFIIGFPGESSAEQYATFDLIEKLWQLTPTPETRVHLYAPYPGTPLYESALSYGFRPPAELDAWAAFDYYEAQTPWATKDMAELAKNYTHMSFSPETVKNNEN